MPLARSPFSHPVLRAALVVACGASFACGAPWALAQPAGPGVTPTPVPLPPSREDTSGLTADIFYRVILGDVALQRGETSLAARAYFEAARDARDARLARRASEVALTARMRGLAQESAKLWATLDPAAERPKQILAALATGSGGKEHGARLRQRRQGPPREGARRCGAHRARTGRDLPAAQSPGRRRVRQAAGVRAGARAREAVSQERGSALCGRARGVQRRRAGGRR